MYLKIKQILLISICLIFIKCLGITHENFKQLDKNAQNFVLAHDFENATKIYDYLLNKTEYNWQKAVILYNLGTVKLAQHENLNALNLYRTIPFESISMPDLFIRLTWNRALAHFNLAQQIDTSSLIGLIEQDENYQQSLHYFEETRHLECLLQKAQELNLPCYSKNYIHFGILQVKYAQQQNRFQQLQLLMNEDNPAPAIFVLLENLNKIKKSLDAINWLKIPIQFHTEYQHYFIEKSENLLTLWEKIQLYTFNLEQKNYLEISSTNFYHFLIHLQKNEMDLAKKNLDQTIIQLKDMNLNSETNFLSLLVFNYQIFLSQNEWSISKLKNLQKLQKKFTKKTQISMQKANDYLDESLANFLIKKDTNGRFFFTAAYIQINSLKDTKNDTPIMILTNALMQAFLSKNLMQMALNLDKISTENIVKESIENVVLFAENFFTKSLDFQRKNFQQNIVESQRCQLHPWDQVFPLFNQGKQAALASISFLKTQPIQAIEEQKKTIKYWQEALKILTSNTQKNGEDINEKNESFDAFLYSIQEMQAQDEIENKETNQEWHTW